jgi:regulator of protease activity HflC (stomatin/prohibitin superfamily)
MIMGNDFSIKPQLPFDGRSIVAALFRLGARILRTRLFWMVAGVLFVGYVVPSCASTYVPPNMLAVRQIVYGSGAGIKRDLYGPGLHFLIPGAERVHLFPHDLQLINFSDSETELSRQYRSAPSIKIQTSDGYNVQLDVTVLYRIADPYHLFTEAGPGRAFEDRLVIPRADRILRKTLGELNSEEFYQGPRRIDKAKAAHDALAAELSPYGLSIDAVLVRRYVYDERYQQLIEGRKIKDQTVFLRQAEAKSAIEQRKRDTIVAEGKANTEIELSRGKAEVQKLDAQADLYRRKKASEGKLLVELAEARGTQLENAALQGAGSENLVGLKMADVLRGVKVLVLSSDGASGFNPLDLASMLRKFEVK